MLSVARIRRDVNSKDGRPPGPRLSRGRWWKSSSGPQSPGIVQPVSPARVLGLSPVKEELPPKRDPSSTP